MVQLFKIWNDKRKWFYYKRYNDKIINKDEVFDFKIDITKIMGSQYDFV